VQTPEFAGITFHEVLAKSALNHVPGSSSALPFGWTINPYRGCSHACVMCVDPETLVLMGDGRQLPIWMVRPGDEIFGTVVDGAYRRYVKTRVLAQWNTRKHGYRVTLGDGTEIIASADHRFLTDHGWKFVRGAMSGADQRPHLTLNNKLMGFGLNAPAISRKLDISGRAVKSDADLRIVSIEDLGVEMDMIDIQTGTGDFIANGVISHNCFARKTHEYLDFDSGKDFDTQIVVKVNVAEVLARELARPSWARHPVALGTNTDPYQRAEGRYRLMPGIIAALAASDTPFSILTKGTLLRRDIPLLQAAAERVPVEVAMTIDLFDPVLRESIEPGAPSTEARLATVTAVKEAGLDVSVFLMPVFPYLTDSIAHLDRALGRIAEAGAGSVAYSALHLRPGAREWFWAWLEREHPELAPRYREVYGDGSYAAKEYRAWLAERIRPLLRRHGLERPPRTDPATGVVRAGAIAGMRRVALGADLPGAGLIAAELPAHAAAGVQPTLF
jgi:DNA repair photolyase